MKSSGKPSLSGLPATSGLLRLGRHRGAMMLYFALIGIPVLLFGVTMVGEAALYVTSARSVRLAAENAAVAGAFQFNPGTTTVNQAQARAVALDLLDRAVSVDVIPPAVTVSSRQVSFPTASQVTVSVSYQVRGLGVLSLFGTSTPTRTVVETAFVCVPGPPSAPNPSAPTGGYCTRPQSPR